MGISTGGTWARSWSWLTGSCKQSNLPSRGARTVAWYSPPDGPRPSAHCLSRLCRPRPASVHFHGRHNPHSEFSTNMPKYVYFFGGKSAEGTGKQKELLGGKGANLAEMCLIGLPVPAGFTITTEVCTFYYARNKTYPAQPHAQGH